MRSYRRGFEHQQKPQSVIREIPVTNIYHADGRIQTITPDTEPCNKPDCFCCLIWIRDLGLVRDAIVRHDAERHGLANRQLDNCIICQISSGAIDVNVVGE